MIDCMKCYRCVRIDDIVYCPFFDINPCYRGEHQIVLPQGKPKKRKHVKNIEVPAALQKSKYYPYLHDLLAALAQRKTITATCKELRLNENSVQEYVHKILEYNGIIKQELINYEFE